MAERWQIRAPKDRWSIRQDEVQPNTPPVSATQAPPVRPVAPAKPGILDRVGEVAGSLGRAAMTPVAQQVTENLGGTYQSLPERLEHGFRGPGGVRDIVSGVIDKVGGSGTTEAIKRNFPLLDAAGNLVEEGVKAAGGLVEFTTSPLGAVLPGAHRSLNAAKAAERLATGTRAAQAARTANIARGVEAGIGAGFTTDMAGPASESIKEAVKNPTTRTVPKAIVDTAMAALPMAGAVGMEARTRGAENARLKALDTQGRMDQQTRIVEMALNDTPSMKPAEIVSTRENLARLRQDPGATPEILERIDRIDNYLQQERTERIARNEWPEIEPTAGGVEKGGDPAAKPVRSDSPRAVEVGDVAEVYRDSDVRADANGDILVTKPGGSRLRVTQNGVTVEPGDVPEGMVATGKYIPERVTLTKIEAGILGNVEDALIQLSPERGADAQTFLHEHWHDVQRMAPLNAVQRKALERLGNAEAQAEAYANWSLADREGRAPNVPVFRKIQRHFSELYDKVLNRPEAVFREKERTAFRGEKPEVDGPVIQSVEQARASNAGSNPAGSTPLEEVRRAEAKATPAPEALLTEPTRFAGEAARQPIVDESAAETPASPARPVSAVAETVKEPWQMSRQEVKSLHDEIFTRQNETGTVGPQRDTQLKLENGKLAKLQRQFEATQMPSEKLRSDIERQRGVVADIKQKIDSARKAQDDAARADAERRLGKYPDLFESRPDYPYIVGKGNYSDLFIDHRGAVRKALREGKPVPPEVLADYPDLKSSAPASAPAVPPEIKPVGEVAQPEIAGLQPQEAGAAGTGQYQMRQIEAAPLPPDRSGEVSVARTQSGGDPTLSPSRRKTMPRSLWRQNLPPDVETRYKQNYERLRGTMPEVSRSDAEVQRLADDIAGPELAKKIIEKKWREGEVMTDVEFRAATDTHNQMLSESVREETALMEAKEKGLLSPEELASREFALAELNKNIARFEEAILPMPTAMGRMLRSLRFIANQHFDTGYFLRKAAKAWGAETPNDLPERIRKPIVAAADAGQKAEQAKILEILERREQTLDPGVKDSTVKRYTDEIEGRKPKASRPTTPEERKALADDPEVKDLREKVHEARAKSKPIKTADQILAAAIERERKRLSRKLEGEETTASVERLTTEQRKQLFQDPVIQSLKAKLAEQRDADRIAVAARAKERELRKIDRKFAELNGEKPKVTRDQLTVEEKADLDADPEIRARRKELAHALAKAHRTSLPMWIAGGRRAGLLFASGVMGRNVIGTGTYTMLFQPISTIGATGIDMLMSGIRKAALGEGLRTRTIPNYGKALKTMGTRGLKESGEILSKGYTEEGLENLDYSAGLNLDTTNGFALGVQKIWNFMLRFQTAQDRPFARFAEAAKLSEQEKLGYTAQSPALADKNALEYARKVTFNTDNVVSTTWSRALSGKPEIVRALATLVVPFSRTPPNLGIAVGEATVPGGALRIASAVYKAMREKGWTQEFQEKVATTGGNMLAGAGFIALGYWLEQNGLLSGPFSFADDMREVKEASGVLPVALKVGGKAVAMTATAPVGILAGIGAALSETDRRNRVERVNGLWNSAWNSALQAISIDRYPEIAWHAARQFIELPMMTGARDIVESAKRVEEGGKSELPDAFRNPLSNYAASFVPSLSGEIARSIDDTKRVTKGKDFAESVKHATLSRIPILSKRVPAEVDALGRKIPQPTGINAFNPFPIKDDLSQQPVQAALLEEFMHIPDLKRLPYIEGETPHMRARRQEIIGGLRQMALAEAIAGDEYKATQFEDDPEARLKILGDAIEEANKVSKYSDFLGDDYRTIPPEEKMRRLDEAYSNLVKRLQEKK